MKKHMQFATKVIHAGVEPDPNTGAVMTPIFQTSTYAQEAPGVHKGYEYSRTHNPTRTALQNNLAALENGRFAYVFGSGLAATDTLLRTFQPGDEVIVTDDLYGGTYRLFVRVIQNFGLKFKFVPMRDAASIEEYITPQTKLIWIETPTNPLMNIIDIEAVANIAKKHRVMLAVDNTFASPYLQNPLNLGADVVMHSATKYLGGHSDVVMGVLITSNEELAQKIGFLQNAVGAVSGPMDCFLMLRGIKTLHVRMQRHCENGKKVAHWLRNHPKVEKVYWVGFEDHPNHDVAKRQMKDFGGMVSFILKGDDLEEAKRVMSSFEVFTLAESLGGVESLCTHPATMTHASIPKEQREKAGLKDTLIRLSVGIEDVDDLIEDLRQAIG
jgi:cystathionine beta-lyase/cystathionine gamma-synthase